MKNADKPSNPVTLKIEKVSGYGPMGPHYKTVDDIQLGLTKKEYFTALAMQGILSNSNIIGQHSKDGIEWVTKHSILQAEDILKQLEK